MNKGHYSERVRLTGAMNEDPTRVVKRTDHTVTRAGFNDVEIEIHQPTFPRGENHALLNGVSRRQARDAATRA